MSKFDISKAIFWVLLTGVSLILVLVIVITLSPNNNHNGEIELTPEEQEKIIQAQYTRDITIMFDEYIKEVGAIEDLEVGDGYLEVTKEVKAGALGMSVPEDSKAMHLDIIVSLNYIVAGFEGDEASLNQGKEMLSQILSENSLYIEE